MLRPVWRKYGVAPFLNLSMRDKMFVLFLLVSILPLLSFVYYSYHSVKTQLVKQTYANMRLMTSQIGSNLENKLNNYTKLSASLYLDSTLQEYLVKSYGDNADYLDAYRYIDNVMNNALTNNPEVDAITIYSTNENMPLDDLFIKPLDDLIREKPWFDKVKRTYGNVIFTVTPAVPANAPFQAEPPMFTLVRYLNYNSLNFPYGILTIDVKEEDLYSLMAKEDDNRDIFIVDEHGTIVSNKDKNLLNTPIEALLSMPKEGSDQFETVYKGERVLVVSTTIRNGWKAVSIVPYSGFIRDARASSNRVLLIASICIVLCVVLIYLVARLSTKRIESLLKNIRRLEREDFDLPSVPMGHDEIGQMSFALSKMALRFKNLINEVYKKELSKKEAEMSMLQAQINPHFLYNTLASISALAMKHNDPQIQDMVSHLAKFYRVSLNKGKTIITLSEELRLTRSYVAIQQIRYGEMLRVQYDIDETALVHHSVKLMLQPFVENAIHHAFWDEDLGITIVIRCYREADDIWLEVVDDGMGMAPDALDKVVSVQDAGYGIRNVNERIKLAFGDDYGVAIFSRLGIGTQVRIRLPAGGVL
jgi:two-component system sensor histidine kinase YesM